MTRLNQRAVNILRAEIEKYSDTATLQVQRDIVLKRLTRLSQQSGSPATLAELRAAIVEIIPNFSEKVLTSAARANGGLSKSLNKVKWSAATLVSATGLLWIANLPYPMIRLPIAKTAPILLLPSYVSMDYHYRQAVASVEQADQLVNRATSVADLSLGETKIAAAQKHLDALPVWFLGYQPSTFLFGWQFTLDEFETARANIGRLQAKVFQEKNAQTHLKQSIKAFDVANSQYQQGKTAASESAMPSAVRVCAAWCGSSKATIASMQVALDRMTQVPSETLAGRAAQTQLPALQRNFEQLTGLAVKDARTNTLIAAAQQYALAAQKQKNAPRTSSEWNSVAQMWELAINQLQQVTLEDPGYVASQKLLAAYRTNLAEVQSRLQAEQESLAALQQVKQQTTDLLANASTSDRSYQLAQLQGIINQLENVKSGTTAYPEAQRLLRLATKKARSQS